MAVKCSQSTQRKSIASRSHRTSYSGGIRARDEEVSPRYCSYFDSYKEEDEQETPVNNDR